MRKSTRKITIVGDFAFIPLTQGYVTKIDSCSVDLVDEYNWSARVSKRKDGTVRSVYASRTHEFNGVNKSIHLHRVIMNAQDGFYVDHIDSDGLNCTFANMRISTNAQNSQNQRRRPDNTSGVKGGCFDKWTSSWKVRIRVDGIDVNIGRFSCLNEAKDAYKEASEKHHGEFGRTS